MDNTVGSLTPVQYSVIVGSILGDGYLRIMPGRRAAFLEINHSINEKDYVDWKYQILRNLVRTGPKPRKGKEKRIAYRFFTRQHPQLTDLLRNFYRINQKIIPENLQLNSLMITVWFMDDGSKTYNTYYLNTQRFSRETQLRLIRILKEQFGIKSSLNKDKIYYRLRIYQESAEKFIKIIKKYLIPSMRYKLGL